MTRKNSYLGGWGAELEEGGSDCMCLLFQERHSSAKLNGVLVGKRATWEPSARASLAPSAVLTRESAEASLLDALDAALLVHAFVMANLPEHVGQARVAPVLGFELGLERRTLPLR